MVALCATGGHKTLPYTSVVVSKQWWESYGDAGSVLGGGDDGAGSELDPLGVRLRVFLADRALVGA